MKPPGWAQFADVVFTTLIGAAVLAAAAAALGDAPAAGSGQPDGVAAVRVAVVTYAGGKTSKCFAAGFLADTARLTHIPLDRQFASVALDSQELFAYPFIVLSGEGKFTLSDEEMRNLALYLQRGGFLLASAGCSNAGWADSFRAAMKSILPGVEGKPLELAHAVFHTLYDIDVLRSRQPTPDGIKLYGYAIDGRLAVVFSPYGLNDTAHAGGGCCCCGGNELQNAHLVNANLLAYAMTH